jgi:hypothetical protein
MKTLTSTPPRVAAGIVGARHPEKRLTKLLNKTLETSL